MKTLFIKKSFLLVTALIAACGILLGVCAGFAVKNASKINPAMPTVAIDAGHGGIDNGVQGIETGADEADINLAIARLLKAQFINAGFNVVMTRSSEAGLYDSLEKGFKMRDMKKRREIVENSSADIVISVHQNYCPLPTKRGGTVFFEKDDPAGEELACAIQEELNSLEECIKPNEALAGDYYMLKCTQNASVIVECGFLSNAEDDRLLSTDDYRRKVAYAIYKGAITYLATDYFV